LEVISRIDKKVLEYDFIVFTDYFSQDERAKNKKILTIMEEGGKY